MRALSPISLFLMCFAVQAQADVEWIRALPSCEEYAGQINTRFGLLGGISRFPPGYKGQLREALEIGCTGKFADCGFIHCSIPESALYSIDGKLIRKMTPATKDLKSDWGEKLSDDRVKAVKAESAARQAQILGAAASGDQIMSAAGKGWEEFEVPLNESFKPIKVGKPKSSRDDSGPPGSQFGH